MNPNQWGRIRYFAPTERWGDPARMNFDLLQALDRLRARVGRVIKIHCGYDQRPSGQHPKGRAVDCHIVGLSPMLQFLAAIRHREFTGIGLYLWWNNPGLHLDNRPLRYGEPRALWGSPGKGVYVPMDAAFMAKVFEFEQQNGAAA